MSGIETPGDAAGLFDYEAPPPVSLADRFVVPPFSVLDRRGGQWQDRRSRWLSIGIMSELGRDAELTFSSSIIGNENYKGLSTLSTTSVFDPVLCEVAYRWFSPEGGKVLDPFAGGSVRGITASILEREYIGIDLRPEQVAANNSQKHLGSPKVPPLWLEGDSGNMHALLGNDFDFDYVFSCPPYADLEVYSDNPLDLSRMDADGFDIAHHRIIGMACEHLKPNRFATWVISDVRDKKGMYRGIVRDTINSFEAAGLRLYNDLIILDPVGTAAVRSGPIFKSGRKVTRTHQHMLVFVKGDPKEAALASGAETRSRAGVEDAYVNEDDPVADGEFSAAVPEVPIDPPAVAEPDPWAIP